LTQHKTIYHIKREDIFVAASTSTSTSTSSVQHEAMGHVPRRKIDGPPLCFLPSSNCSVGRLLVGSAIEAISRRKVISVRSAVRCNSRRGQFWLQSASMGNVSEPIYCCSPHRIVSLRTIPRSERINRDPIRQNHKEKKT